MGIAQRRATPTESPVDTLSTHGETRQDKKVRTSTITEDRIQTLPDEPSRYILSLGSHYPLRVSRPPNLALISQRLGRKILSSRSDALLALLTQDEAEALSLQFEGLYIEKDVQHQPLYSPLTQLVKSRGAPPSGGSCSIDVKICSAQNQTQGIQGARVDLYPSREEAPFTGITDASGLTTILVDRALQRFERCLVEPRMGFYASMHQDVPATSPLNFELHPIEVPVDGCFDWGHQRTQAPSAGSYLGVGVRVCVIDSGISLHRSLRVMDGRNFVDGESHADWGKDVTGHGTHCAGVIAAQRAPASTWGYAPEVELYAARIFGHRGIGGDVWAIVGAIEWAVERGCRIINMSFGAPQPVEYLKQAIKKAADAGVLFVAATGNSGEAVLFPAAYPDVVAVGAVGCNNVYPKTSAHVRHELDSIARGTGRFTDFYAPSFSCRGPGEVAFCAPGVAITSTVRLPHDGLACWDGTSMASPHIAGIASIALQHLPSIRNAPLQEQPQLLLAALKAAALDLGLPPACQGAGMPCLQALLRQPSG